MADEPEKTLDAAAEETRTIGEGLELEVEEDVEKAKRPWWKIWARD
jgi:hypothetical protein